MGVQTVLKNAFGTNASMKVKSRTRAAEADQSIDRLLAKIDEPVAVPVESIDAALVLLLGPKQ